MQDKEKVLNEIRKYQRILKNKFASKEPIKMEIAMGGGEHT